MSTGRTPRQSSIIETKVGELKLENGVGHGERGKSRTKPEKLSPSSSAMSPVDASAQSTSNSPTKNEIVHSSTPVEEKQEEVVGGDVTLKMEPGEPPKLARSSSQKIKARPPRLYLEAMDRTAEAQKDFSMLPECTYSNRYIGSTEHDSMDCDCEEEWDAVLKVNAACGQDSDCINRVTKMECVGECGCGSECQNQRFQQRQYAPVTVFETNKKGYGLRADADLSPEDFIYEYIGEVIGEAQFRKRMVHYDEEGIKHFYFMSLTQGEFVDATKKGNLGRFCNHSCNPNCYVDKWMVGEKLRMGIFAERKIKAGEELTFNYNVDRYGANPQPCYCDEPNCTGFIGGRTQTERATKLPQATIEALGIDDGDNWDTAVAKKPRKKKVGEDDEEYVNNVQPKALTEDGVAKVISTLMQSKDKWIVVKLLSRIQLSADEKVRARVVKMHGYQCLGSNLALWKEDENVVLQIFDILDKFPRLTRNKIADSKIEATVESLKNSDSEKVASRADYLLQEWATLEVAYRIPLKKREVDATATSEKLNRFARRGSRDERKVPSRSNSKDGSRSRSRSLETPKGPSAPSGPRSNFPQRQPGYHAGPRPPFRPRPFTNGLPEGWFAHKDEAGRTYYYDLTGTTTWDKPRTVSKPPGPPTKPKSANQNLDDLIIAITKAKENEPKEKVPPPTTTQPTAMNAKSQGGNSREKWRSLPEEKQMKLYENTLFPHVKYIMDKFKGKLPNEDLKRFSKEISKKIVTADFKKGRVADPTKIDTKKEKAVKLHVKEYLDKAAKKHKERENLRAERKARETNGESKEVTEPDAKGKLVEGTGGHSDGDEDMIMSDDEEESKPKLDANTPLTPMDQMSIMTDHKRKRAEADDAHATPFEDPEATPSKIMRSEAPPAPPPPPSMSEDDFQSPLGLPADVSNGGPSAFDSPVSLDPRAPQEATLVVDGTLVQPPPPPPPPPNAIPDTTISPTENTESPGKDVEHAYSRHAIET